MQNKYKGKRNRQIHKKPTHQKDYNQIFILNIGQYKSEWKREREKKKKREKQKQRKKTDSETVYSNRCITVCCLLFCDYVLSLSYLNYSRFVLEINKFFFSFIIFIFGPQLFWDYFWKSKIVLTLVTLLCVFFSFFCFSFIGFGGISCWIHRGKCYWIVFI